MCMWWMCQYAQIHRDSKLTLGIMVVWIGMPWFSCVRILGPKGEEPLGGIALLEKLSLWGQTLRLYYIQAMLSEIQSPSAAFGSCCRTLSSCFSTMSACRVPCFPYDENGLNLWNWNQLNVFFLYSPLSCFYYRQGFSLNLKLAF